MPHSINSESATPFHVPQGPYPLAPYPEDLESHPLLVVDYELIAAGTL